MNNDIPQDKELSQLYRASAIQEPPTHIDAAIIAAAKREAGSRSWIAALPFFKRSWQIPVSITAAFVITLSLFPLMKDHTIESDLRSESRQDKAKTQPEASEKTIDLNEALKSKEAAMLNGGRVQEPILTTPAAPIEKKSDQVAVDSAAPSSNDKKALARLNEEAVAAKTKSQSGFAPDPQPMQQRAREMDTTTFQSAKRNELAAPPTSPAPVVAEKFEGKILSKQSAGNSDMPSPPPTPAAARAPEVSRNAYRSERRVMADSQLSGAASTNSTAPGKDQETKKEAVTPQEWVKDIEKLVLQNKLSEAKIELANFRKRYPYYPVPQALKDRLDADNIQSNQ